MNTQRTRLLFLTRLMLRQVRLSKLLSLRTKWMLLWPPKTSVAWASLRAVFCAVLSSLALISSIAQAGGGGGGMGGVGGATEVTQILNNVQLVEQYAQQVLSYQNQLMQYATMVQNLTKNPLGVLAPDLMQMAGNAARIMNMGQDIASSMARVDQTFASTFKNPIAAAFGTKFSLWTTASKDALKSAMLNAGLQREQFADDASALQGLVQSLSSSDGNLAALQALGGINARQVQESMKLRDLISQQQVAQNTYLASQSAKGQAKQDISDIFTKPYTEKIPVDAGKADRAFDWKRAK
ncbi:hypothetical protein RHDC4_00660 [Rhodocyclaceae bacterium]|nr:hypothetical protein RHDC4_00660 [Rhodocyclaceae bacterium]